LGICVLILNETQKKELKDGIEKNIEAIKAANKEYRRFLLDQDFIFTTEQSCYYWTTYLAVHKSFIDRFIEHGRDYYNKEEGLEPIPDWAIIEITKEVSSCE